MWDMTQDEVAGEMPERKFVFTGAIGKLYPIFLVNLLLMIVTLGIYRFWGKTRIRKYLWSNMSLADDPFEYGGTGLELFFGSLIILVTVIFPLGLLGAVVAMLQAKGQTSLAGGLQAVEFFGIYYLIGVGTFAMLRYRLTRTRWRGIRGGVEGSALVYGFRFLGYALLTGLSLGIAVPWMQIKHLSQLYNRASFGSERFQFDAPVKPLMKRWLVVCCVSLGLLVVMAIGLSSVGKMFQPTDMVGEIMAFFIVVPVVLAAMFLNLFWYQAKFLSHVYSHLSLGGLRFRYSVTAWRLFGLVMVNLLIVLFTLGLGMPVVVLRTVQFVVGNLTVIGDVDFAAIMQNQQTAPKFGEGLAAAFDIGAV